METNIEFRELYEELDFIATVKKLKIYLKITMDRTCLQKGQEL